MEDRGNQIWCNTNGEWINPEDAWQVWPKGQPRPATGRRVTCRRCADHHVARNGMQAEPYRTS
jgi:hypothetical protein